MLNCVINKNVNTKNFQVDSNMANNNHNKKSEIFMKLNHLHNSALNSGLISESELYEAYKISLINTVNNANSSSSTINNQQNERSRRRQNAQIPNNGSYKTSFIYCFSLIISIFIATPFANHFWEYFMGIRCLVPNNYLVWEATRPVSDCHFCDGITKPLILMNLTQDEFLPYAYSSQPIIIKNAVTHWPAMTLLNFSYLKDLYLKLPNAMDSVHEECQFLNFKSNFMTLRDVFEMSNERVEFKKGERPWYVGWSNCHTEVLNELRKLYPRPHFLPNDAEMPNTDFVFLGYEQGAIMHLDYIPRLMWQAQLQGNKTWVVAPTPECDKKCNSFSFYVEPGDAGAFMWGIASQVLKTALRLIIYSELPKKYAAYYS